MPRERALPRHLLAAGWIPAPGRAWPHRLLLPAAFADLVPAGTVLYLLETLRGRAEPMQLLVRADLRTGAVSYAARLVPVAEPAPLAVTRSGVWLLGSAWLSRNGERSGPLTLYRFDPATLRLVSRRRVGPCCQQATLAGWAGGRLWLSADQAVRLVRPVPWVVQRTVRVRAGAVQWLSFTPDRHRVYLAVGRAGPGGGQLLQERALPGWRLLHTGTVPGVLAIGPIAAANGEAVAARIGPGHGQHSLSPL